MKHLLNGVAIAAVLAIASPVWAQSSGMAPSRAPAPAPAPSTMAPPPAAGAPPAAGMPAGSPPMAGQMHRRMRHMATHRMMRRRMGMMGPSGDAMTEQLNRDELSRIQSGQPMPMPMQGGPMPMQGGMMSPGVGPQGTLPPDPSSMQNGPRPSGH